MNTPVRGVAQAVGASRPAVRDGRLVALRRLAMCVAVLAVAQKATPALGQVYITEWMYDGNGGGFVEFTNLGGEPVDLTGWSFDDEARLPGTFDLSGFGLVPPGVSVVVAESTASTFISDWGLSDIAVIGGLGNVLDQDDEINLYDAQDALVDRLTYGVNAFPGTINTLSESGVPISAPALGANDVAQWQLASSGSGSWQSASGDNGNPGRSCHGCCFWYDSQGQPHACWTTHEWKQPLDCEPWSFYHPVCGGCNPCAGARACCDYFASPLIAALEGPTTACVGDVVSYVAGGYDLDGCNPIGSPECVVEAFFDDLYYGFSTTGSGLEPIACIDPKECHRCYRVTKKGNLAVSVTVDDEACLGADDNPDTAVVYLTTNCCGPEMFLEPARICPGQTAIATTEHTRCVTWSYEVLDGEELEIETEQSECDCEVDPTNQNPQSYKLHAKKGRGKVRVVAKDCKYPDCQDSEILEIGCQSCGSGQCQAGSASAQLNDGMDVGFPLGRNAEGEPVGTLRILASAPHSNLGNPLGLHAQRNRPSLAGPSEELQVIERDGMLRQLLSKADKVLADIAYDAQTAPYEYTVSFYSEPEGGWQTGQDGLYVTSGLTPYVYYEVEAVSAPTDFNTLRIRELNATAVQQPLREFTYTYSSSQPGAWSWSLATGDGVAIAREETQSWTDEGGGEWTRVVTVEQDGGTVSQITETLKEYTWGKGVTQRDIDSGAGTLTTQFWYQEDRGQNAEPGRLWKQQNPDGSWLAHRYDSSGRLTHEITSYLDDTLPTDPGENDGRCTKYIYGTEHSLPIEVQEFVHGALVAKTTITYTNLDAYNRPEVRVERQFPDPAGSAYLETRTEYVESDRDHVERIDYPDGRVDSYEYLASVHLDDSDPTGPIAYLYSAGDEHAVLIRHWYKDGADQILPGKSTVDVSVFDRAGRLRYSATHVLTDLYSFDGTPVSWTLRQYDARGRLTDLYGSDGTHTEHAWDCCSQTSTTDATGVVTTSEPDVLGRAMQQTKLGLTGGPVENDITTEVDYGVAANPARRVVTTTVSGGGLSLTTTRENDLAGRVVREVDEAGLETTYAHGLTAQGGRLVTVTRADTSTEISAYYRDGRVKSVSGTGVVARTYEYGVSSGVQWTKLYTGPNGTSSPRCTKTTYDGLGRVVTEESPQFGGGTAVTYHNYDGAGRLDCIIPPGSTPPACREFDGLGNVVLAGTNADGDEGLSDDDPDSPDRLTRTETAYAQIGGHWWRVSTTSAYVFGSTEPVVTNETRERLTGFATGVTREVWAGSRPDPQNQGEYFWTISTTAIDREAREVSETTESPDATTPAVTVSINGFVVSSTTKSGLTYTYAYDVLGRRTHVIDPRDLATVTTYDGDTGQVVSVDSAGQTTSYEYYGDGEVGAGRVKVITNDAGKTTRYAYTARGETSTLWGDVPQPVKMEYDAYGQREKLHTYRGGTSWANAVWPGDAEDSDVTTWTYDPGTGLLASKTYDDGRATTYTYHADGKLATRTWARNAPGTSSPIVTTYFYYDDAGANTGDLETIDYSDATQDVTFTYTRTGQLATVLDATGTREFGYSDQFETEFEDLPDGYFGVDRDLRRAFSSAVVGRLASVTLGSESDPDAEYGAAYEWDAATGHMKRVTGLGLPGGAAPDPDEGAWYGYFANTDFVSTLELRNASGGVLVRATRAYETTRNLVDSVTNTWMGDETPPCIEISKYDYTNDDLGRRSAAALSGAAFSAGYTLGYGYNDRNELTSATRDSADPPTWTYGYDPIGNRTAATAADTEAETTYTANALNQYLRAMTVVGGKNVAQGFRHDADGNLAEEYVAADMNCDEHLDFFDIDPFVLAIMDPTEWHAQFPGCDILNGDLNGDGLVNFFDIDGFLAAVTIGGGGVHREYHWDAENRLTAVVPLAPVPGSQRVEYAYDYLGRRVERRVFDWDPDANGGAGAWETTPVEKTRYIWDGWLQLAELDALNLDAQSRPKLLKTYVWGLDLSGTREGAAGIGGLLAVYDTNGTVTGQNPTADDKQFAYLHDANGNVTQLIGWRQTAVMPNSDEWGAARLVAACEYDAYGNVVAESGSYAAANRWRFSTREFDAATALGAWIARPLLPPIGRWGGRDKIGELTPTPSTSLTHALLSDERLGQHEYSYAENAPEEWFDPDGRLTFKKKPKPTGPPPTTGPATPGESAAGRGNTCGLEVKRSAICTLSPKRACDFGHEWIEGAGGRWDFPKDYSDDPCHEWDRNHPVWQWNAHVRLLGGQLPDGTSCGAATCSQITSCLQAVEDEWASKGYDFLAQNCISFVDTALGKCCMSRGALPTRVPELFEEERLCCERCDWMREHGCDESETP